MAKEERKDSSEGLVHSEEKLQKLPKKGTFVKFPQRALQDMSLKKGHLLVLLSIYSFMDNKTRTCYPSVELIAERSRFSKIHARNYLNELICLDYVQRKKMGGGRYATTYWLTPQ